MTGNLEYKIFTSEEWDWYIAAKKDKDKPKVLYEGHSLEKAYESILEDIGVDVPIEERPGMEETGTYTPTKEDFSE